MTGLSESTRVNIWNWLAFRSLMFAAKTRLRGDPCDWRSPNIVETNGPTSAGIDEQGDQARSQKEETQS
jgi:hypothetical protein